MGRLPRRGVSSARRFRPAGRARAGRSPVRAPRAAPSAARPGGHRCGGEGERAGLARGHRPAGGPALSAQTSARGEAGAGPLTRGAAGGGARGAGPSGCSRGAAGGRRSLRSPGRAEASASLPAAAAGFRRTRGASPMRSYSVLHSSLHSGDWTADVF